jgi:5-methylcytosine-specific restriction endonuclease McrA
MAKTYSELLKEPEWQFVRGRILERDGWKCRNCRAVHNLQVHHKKYEKGIMPWDYPYENLITLCDRCHKDAHGITESDEGEDMRDPFVRLRQFIKDWKGLILHTKIKEQQKAEEEKQNG